MRIIWSETAIANLIEIKEFIAQDKPGAARRVATRILASAEQLVKHPHLGHPGREPETRELVVAGTLYILPYRVLHGKIFILAVLHGAGDRDED
jgi:toxin ParE1/3/4